MKKYIIASLVFVATVVFAASTYTTNYNLEKPSDGSTSWGEAIRDNFDTIDSQMKINNTTVVDHIADTVDAHDASAISFDTGSMVVCAAQTTVQAVAECFDSQINTLVGGGAVDISSAQTITGLKTFSTTPKFTALSNGVLHITSGDGTIDVSTIVNADVDASAAIDVSKLATLTADKALQTSAGGVIEASTVTSTELGYLSGVTSSVLGKDDTGTFTNKTITSPVIGGTITTPTNTDLTIAPNGTGEISINKPIITPVGSNTDIELAPDGTGTVILNGTTTISKGLSVTDTSDVTKRIVFDASPSTTTTDTTIQSNSTVARTIDLPDADTTLVGTNTTDTLSNKTISSPVLSGTVTTASNGDVVIDPNGTGIIDLKAEIKNSESSDIVITPTATFGVQLGGDYTALKPILMKDATDGTKQLNITVSGSATSTTTTLGVSSTAARSINFPDASGNVLVDSATQTVSGKTFSDAFHAAEIATPSTPSSGYMKLYPKSDKKFYALDSNGLETEIGAGGGAGGINYIDNPDAEADVSGYAAYADAAATTPVDGTGGSPTVTWTRNTSSPLRGSADFLLTKDAANRQGEGVSYDFTVDAADKAKIMRISFDYDFSDADYTDDDIGVFVYDVTNAVLIRTTNEGVKAGKGTHITEFQTASDSTSYRLILHVADTTASAWTLYVDNVQVGPREIARGSVVTDWVSYTPTFNGFGTPSSVTVKYRRVGDSLEVHGVFTAGTTTASSAYFSLPSGLTVDSSKIAQTTAVGKAFMSASPYSGGIGAFPGTSSSNLFITNDSANPNAITNGNTWASSTIIGFSAKVPITGWASNTTMSSDFGGRVISSEAYLKTTGQTITAGNDTVVIFNTEDNDTVSGYSTSTGLYTAQETGYYLATYNLLILTGATAPTNMITKLVRNAGSDVYAYRYDDNLSNAKYHSHVASSIVYLAKGDTLSVNVVPTAQNVTVASTGGTSRGSSFSVMKIQSPQTLMGSERVSFKARTDSGAAIGTGATDVVFDDEVWDTHNAFDTSTGVFTVPETGEWEFDYSIQTAAVTLATTERVLGSVQLDTGGGYAEVDGSRTNGTGGSNTFITAGKYIAYLTKGSLVKIQGRSSVATTLNTGSVYASWFSGRLRK